MKSTELETNQFQEAEAYLRQLRRDGGKTPIDIDECSYTMQLPDWYDASLFKRAQIFYTKNMFAVMAGKLCGLLAVLAPPSTLKILISSDTALTPFAAYKRYVETVFHTIAWYECDLKPGSRSWKSLESVRRGHIIASKYAERMKYGFISQRDMALTQFGFVGYVLLRPEKLGIQVNDKDFEAFVHFWRVIGHMIGIQDEYNLCSDSYHSTKLRLEVVLREVYRPHLEDMSNDFRIITKAIIEGLWYFVPILDWDAVVYFTKWLSDCKNHAYFENDLLAANGNLVESQMIIKSLNWHTRWILYIEITAHTYLAKFSLFRWLLNYQVWLSQFIIYWFPFLAFYKFGIKKSYVRILNGNK